jgi:hypothetical protein
MVLAPEMEVPLPYHWYVSGAVPLAATVNVAVCPAATVTDAGWVVMAGAVACEPLFEEPPSEAVGFEFEQPGIRVIQTKLTAKNHGME